MGSSHVAWSGVEMFIVVCVTNFTNIHDRGEYCVRCGCTITLVLVFGFALGAFTSLRTRSTLRSFRGIAASFTSICYGVDDSSYLSRVETRVANFANIHDRGDYCVWCGCTVTLVLVFGLALGAFTGLRARSSLRSFRGITTGFASICYGVNDSASENQ
ncbi:hypothetical protein F5890DRAFT_1539598 [Lentinula detonsa]|uniref:Uncharacterized protein n=1 Tax=Lentinula detonsa TaxID=2804962 RepID=A0AA38UPN5_9AGAR|nr:hypothetical protein F5890DRAFT_1539598 [Lentinula detonsa]